MQHVEPEERQLVVVGRAATADGGVGPTLNPARPLEFLETVLDAARSREHLAPERAAELEELSDGQGQRSSARSISSSRSVRCRECEVVAITKYNWYHASARCTSSFACMNREKSGFINVEELMAQVTLERARRLLRRPMPEMHRVGTEVRTRCFLTCGRNEETGIGPSRSRRTIRRRSGGAIDAGCGQGGNLVSLCDLMKPGEQRRREATR